MTNSFKELNVTPLQIEWLRKIASTDESDIDKQLILYQQLVKEGLNPYEFDYRVVSGGRPTLVGYWYVNEASEIFDHMDQMIRLIQKKASKGEQSIGIQEIAESLKVEEYYVLVLHSYLREIDMHLDFDGAPFDQSTLKLPDGHMLVRYLQYDTLFKLMGDGFKRGLGNLDRFTDEAQFELDRNLKPLVNPGTAFIIMGMNAEDALLVDAHNAYKEACADFGITAKRVDDIEHGEVITDVILKQIATSELIIGDLTGERPNVYYEIGYAHALGKTVHLFRRKGTPLHFDLVIHNAPEYDNITGLKKILSRRLSEALGREPAKQTAGMC